MKELVSIAMTTYNGAVYLEEQLDSIYAQTYNNFEVIVVDDDSSDNTTLILDQYNKKHGLKYYVNDKNLGVTKNFEKAITLCKGEYIVLVDQDDVWLPKKIEILYENIGSASLIYSDAYIINEKSELQNKTAKNLYPRIGLDSSTKDIYNYIVMGSFILGCSIMFKRELISDLLPFYNSQRNHDWWLSVCAYNKNGIQYIDEILFCYRHHNNNYSRNGKKISGLQKVFDFYSKERNFNRKKNVIEQYTIINYLLKRKMYSNIDDKVFLLEMNKFCLSFLNTKIHFKALVISLKYEKYMFLNKGKFENKLHLISRLIG